MYDLQNQARNFEVFIALLKKHNLWNNQDLTALKARLAEIENLQRSNVSLEAEYSRNQIYSHLYRQIETVVSDKKAQQSSVTTGVTYHHQPSRFNYNATSSGAYTGTLGNYGTYTTTTPGLNVGTTHLSSGT